MAVVEFDQFRETPVYKVIGIHDPDIPDTFIQGSLHFQCPAGRQQTVVLIPTVGNVVEIPDVAGIASVLIPDGIQGIKPAHHGHQMGLGEMIAVGRGVAPQAMLRIRIRIVQAHGLVQGFGRTGGIGILEHEETVIHFFNDDIIGGAAVVGNDAQFRPGPVDAVLTFNDTQMVPGRTSAHSPPGAVVHPVALFRGDQAGIADVAFIGCVQMHVAAHLDGLTQKGSSRGLGGIYQIVIPKDFPITSDVNAVFHKYSSII